MNVVAAVDKFRGTATAAEVAAAIARACRQLGHRCDEVPLADGGEGLLEVLGGANRRTVVTGPLGHPIDAEWSLHDGVAVIEMARASGLALVGGATGNDPLAATTAGVGELIEHALTAGARRIIVGLGGSATTDGGRGAVTAIRSLQCLRRIELLIACDVSTRFRDAATVFGPQKGATPQDIVVLTDRLDRLAGEYAAEFGVDVTALAGGGAAGGLAGGLAAVGGRIVPGFDLVADQVGLRDRIARADLVVTGEGHLDAQSFEGKVVGGVAGIAAGVGVPVHAIVGRADDDVRQDIATTALVEVYGAEVAQRDPTRCIEEAAIKLLSER